MPRFALPGLAALSDRISRLLHSVIFSLPTPTPARNATAAAAARSKHGALDKMQPPQRLLAEPGDARAFAGGIGPLSFVGSRYGLAMIIMAILLNRIHHIVQRPRAARRGGAPDAHPPRADGPGMLRRMRTDVGRWLVSPDAPRWIRIPGIIVLLRAWALFGILTMQVAGVWPEDVAARSAPLAASLPALVAPALEYTARVIDRLGAWVDGKEMANVCWGIFLSVCSGLVCGALANGLDRRHRGDAGGGFNLVRGHPPTARSLQFGYSFLLHFYSSPFTHHAPGGAHHGRPDIHALFQLWLGLTELTWLQAIELDTDLRRNQLLPTAVCGVVGLGHFMYTLATSPLKFPSFTFLTHLMALVLAIIILCTVSLKAFTHIFTLGYLPSPVWTNLLPHEGAVPSIEDDFGVALLKLATACIEATSYSGLRNELAPVEAAMAAPSVQLSLAGCDSVSRAGQATGGFSHRVDEIRAAEVPDANVEKPYVRELQVFWTACARLVRELFWATLLATPPGRKLYVHSVRLWRARWWYGPRQWRFWTRQAWAAPPRLRMRTGDEQAGADVDPAAWASAVQVRPYPAALGLASGYGSRSRSRSRSATPAPYTYDQVLRGEVVVEDDDDDEWASEGEGGTGSESEMDDNDRNDARHMLYRELVAREATPEGDLPPILLAHMTASGSGPLTRRRYTAMLPGAGAAAPAPAVGSGAGPLMDAILSRRMEAAAAAGATGAPGGAGDEWDEERRRTCVVCMVQPRDVILWPCRCLLMCNDCRDGLAARLGTRDNQCPNCRTNVEGYSRIYVP